MKRGGYNNHTLTHSLFELYVIILFHGHDASRTSVNFEHGFQTSLYESQEKTFINFTIYNKVIDLLGGHLHLCTVQIDLTALNKFSDQLAIC